MLTYRYDIANKKKYDMTNEKNQDNNMYLCDNKNNRIPSTRDNLQEAIEHFLRYMTNDDLLEIEQYIKDMKDRRKEVAAKKMSELNGN